MKNVKPGKYRVVAEMSFYSYFDWHNCPSPERISLTIKKKPVNGVNVTETKGLKSQKVRAKFKKVSGAIKKTSYVSKKLKGDKYYGISVRAKVGKKYGPWSPKRRVWVREK